MPEFEKHKEDFWIRKNILSRSFSDNALVYDDISESLSVENCTTNSCSVSQPVGLDNFGHHISDILHIIYLH